MSILTGTLLYYHPHEEHWWEEMRLGGLCRSILPVYLYLMNWSDNTFDAILMPDFCADTIDTTHPSEAPDRYWVGHVTSTCITANNKLGRPSLSMSYVIIIKICRACTTCHKAWQGNNAIEWAIIKYAAHRKQCQCAVWFSIPSQIAPSMIHFGCFSSWHGVSLATWVFHFSRKMK